VGALQCSCGHPLLLLLLVLLLLL